MGLQRGNITWSSTSVASFAAPAQWKVRKSVKSESFPEMYVGIDQIIAADLSQMELYLALGELVSSRPEKGAAVMAAEHISANYPDQTGFSPRNLRRMRDIFRLYEGHPEILEQAMKISWTQNLAIMEADLDLDARYWYLIAAQQFGWSKAELERQIAANAHLETTFKEEAQDNKNIAISQKHPKVKIILKTISQAVDFLNGHWYNKNQQICCFRQMGIVGDAYG